MSDDNNLPKPFAIVIGAITSVIAFITAIVGFTLLWQGNTKIVSTVVIVVGIVGLWGSFFYLRFAKKSEPVQAEKSKSHHRTRHKKSGYVFSEKIRGWALKGIFGLPILALAGVGIGTGIYYSQANQPSKEILVLIADFDGPDPQKYGVTQFLVEQITESFSDLMYVKVKTLNQVITASEGFSKAIEIAKNNKADIIVFGWYVASEKGISVTYHITRTELDTGFGNKLPRDKKFNISAPIEQVNTFEFQSSQLTDNIVSSLMLSIFNAFQNRGDLENTSLVVDRTLTYLENHQASFSNYAELYSRVLSSRAAVNSAEGRGHQESLAMANEAISLFPSYDAYLNRGIINYNAGDLQSAVDDAFFAVSLPVDYTESHTSAYLMIGMIYNEQLKYDEAVKIYTEGILEKQGVCTIINSCYILYYYRGMDYLLLGNKQDAEKDFSIVKNIMNDPTISRDLDTLLASYK